MLVLDCNSLEFQLKQLVVTRFRFLKAVVNSPPSLTIPSYKTQAHSLIVKTRGDVHGGQTGDENEMLLA